MICEVIPFPKHKLHRCTIDNCTLCIGGLSYCQTCHGAEASLTTECCGLWVGNRVQNLIMDDGLDFTHSRGWFFKTTGAVADIGDPHEERK